MPTLSWRSKFQLYSQNWKHEERILSCFFSLLLALIFSHTLGFLCKAQLAEESSVFDKLAQTQNFIEHWVLSRDNTSDVFSPWAMNLSTKSMARKATVIWHCGKVHNGNRISQKILHCEALKGWAAEGVDDKVLAIVQTSFASTSGDRVGQRLQWVYSHHVRRDFGSDFLLKPGTQIQMANMLFSFSMKKTRLKSFAGLFVSQERNKQHSCRCRKGKKRVCASFSVWTNSPRSAACDLQRLTEPRRAFIR